MTSTSGMINGRVSSSSSSASLFRKLKKCRDNKFRASCVSMNHVATSDPYKILRIQPGASEYDVKKAFRQLALKYHPDVCKENDGGIPFQQINEAYDMIMSDLRGETSVAKLDDEPSDDSLRGMDDPDWDMWEEWMGWEGAGIRDYSSHINPYI
uniref:chaperone protein dnaJ 8, chloroplastic-like n=1 Tax=Erigeron canadensis TaxID=72917 RepID=UPI001CB8A9C6|nr:chaperone protein dnaJ 8, chloroplastic-like [Erigeron canadensis]